MYGFTQPRKLSRCCQARPTSWLLVLHDRTLRAMADGESDTVDSACGWRAITLITRPQQAGSVAIDAQAARWSESWCAMQALCATLAMGMCDTFKQSCRQGCPWHVELYQPETAVYDIAQAPDRVKLLTC